MGWKRGSVAPIVLALMLGFGHLGSATSARASAGWAPQAQSSAAPGSPVKSIGTVQAIQGDAITLKTDSGSQISAVVQDSTRLLRIEPGQKTLQGATPIHLQELQVGDRVLVAGKSSEDGKSLLASSLIAMKRADIEQKRHQQEEDWQNHGVGGLVKSVDGATETITLAARVGNANKTITIHTSKDTVLRRYAADSVSFQDAKVGTFDQIKSGDQLRALGTFNADGSVLTAAQIVSGSFRNIAGTVVSIDPGANEVTVLDLITKKPVTVKVTPASELRQLPEVTAQMIASRLKMGPGSVGSTTGGGQEPTAAGPLPARNPSSSKTTAGAHPGAAGGQQDLDRILSGLPPVTVANLKKGDAVMIVSTEGQAAGTVTAIKLVSGVEPILTASAAGHQGAVLRSLWSGFSTSGGGGEPGGGGGTP